MAKTILLFQLLPLAVGLVLHRLSPDHAKLMQKWTAKLANGLLVLFALVVVATQWRSFIGVQAAAVIAVELTVLTALAAGWLLSPRGRQTRVALACTGSIHSVSACVLLASTWFDDPQTLLVVFAYSGCMFTTGVVASRFMVQRQAA